MPGIVETGGAKCRAAEQLHRPGNSHDRGQIALTYGIITYKPQTGYSSANDSCGAKIMDNLDKGISQIPHSPGLIPR